MLSFDFHRNGNQRQSHSVIYKHDLCGRNQRADALGSSAITLDKQHHYDIED